MKKAGNPWSVPVAVEDIPDAGLHIAIEAPAEARAELAELAAVRELLQLSAVFDLTRQGSGVHVSGQVSGRVGQNCVVTLEPVESAVEEAVDLQFAPASETERGPEKRPNPRAQRRRAAGTVGRRHLGPVRLGDRISDPRHRSLSS